MKNKSSRHRAAKSHAAPAPAPAPAIATRPIAPAPPVETVAAIEPQRPLPSREEIAHLAYSYWERRGYAHGFQDDDWRRAEQELSHFAR